MHKKLITSIINKIMKLLHKIKKYNLIALLFACPEDIHYFYNRKRLYYSKLLKRLKFTL